MKPAFSGAVRLCLYGLLLESVCSVAGLPGWFSGLAGVLFLWGSMHLRSLHDGFSAAFVLSLIRLLLIGAGAIPVLRAWVWGSVWSLLIPLCQWIALACFADGFWAVRISRGLPRNRSAAAAVLLQVLIDIPQLYDSTVLRCTIAFCYLAALWYYRRAVIALETCDDPPTL